MTAKKRFDQSLIGFILIFIGIFLLLAKIGMIPAHLFLYFLGGCFLFIYFKLGGNKNYGNIGFLIPGTVLIAISIFADLEEINVLGNFDGGVFFLFLAVAFLIVYLHTNSFKELEWGDRNWPIFPVVGLTLFGLFVILIEFDRLIIEKLKVLDVFIPIIVICLGLVMLFKGRDKPEINEEQKEE